jgi:hypothetical protein
MGVIDGNKTDNLRPTRQRCSTTRCSSSRRRAQPRTTSSRWTTPTAIELATAREHAQLQLQCARHSPRNAGWQAHGQPCGRSEGRCRACPPWTGHGPGRRP